MKNKLILSAPNSDFSSYTTCIHAWQHVTDIQTCWKSIFMCSHVFTKISKSMTAMHVKFGTKNPDPYCYTMLCLTTCFETLFIFAKFDPKCSSLLRMNVQV